MSMEEIVVMSAVTQQQDQAATAEVALLGARPADDGEGDRGGAICAASRAGDPEGWAAGEPNGPGTLRCIPTHSVTERGPASQ
jgi:hypothetical protein